MKIIKTDNQELIEVAGKLCKARKEKGEAEKVEKASKDYIGKFLESEGIIVDQLPINSTLIIKINKQDCIRLTVKGRNDIDRGKLSIEFPSVDHACRKDFPCVYYDALVEDEESDLDIISKQLQEQRKRLEDQLVELNKSIGKLESIKK